MSELPPLQDLADRIVDHYERHAREWDADRRMASWNDKPWHDRFIAALPSGAAVLDLGCGPGFPVAAHMAERGLRVTGVDSSPAMIALCRERLPKQEWRVGDMRTLELSRQFDGCWRGTASFTSSRTTSARCSRFSPGTPSRPRS